MFVEVAVGKDEGAETRGRITAIVQTAIREALGIDPDRTFIRLIDAPGGLQPSPSGKIRIAILVIAGEHFGAAKKRRLFGRIAEIAAIELKIAHHEIVTGIIETPRENWSNGYDERQWRNYLSYQLP